ncbi:unnamed protein product [Dovyalis caffra]|uniref:Uncharacterized protein n=1 Tax=Dovyalis caffra TaxID=77055 RepID=A0AAV1S9K9_9ROSI|nr:unnamed protein product [Dovyalis caffra]
MGFVIATLDSATYNIILAPFWLSLPLFTTFPRHIITNRPPHQKSNTQIQHVVRYQVTNSKPEFVNMYGLLSSCFMELALRQQRHQAATIVQE